MKIPKVGKTEPSNEVAQYGWYNALYKLAGGEYLRINEVLLTPIDETFMFLSYDNTRTYDEAVTFRRSSPKL